MIDGAGNAVIGGTSTCDFPRANAYPPAFAGESDGFISKIGGANPLPTASPTVPVAHRRWPPDQHVTGDTATRS